MAKKNALSKTDKGEGKTMMVATAVGQTVSGLKKKSSPLFKIVNNFTIKTPADQAKMVQVLQKIKALGKEAEREQAAFVDPAKAIQAQAKSFFKPFLDSVEEATDLGKEKVLRFVNKRLAQSTEIGKNFSEGKGKISKLATVVTRQAELEDNENTRKIWKLKITNPNAIPRKFLEPNETLIREALKKGKKVPGCKLEQETTIAV